MKTRFPHLKHWKARTAPGTDDGFARIELCVVLLTLALLSCLVMTTLAQSSGHSARTVCANNLRLLGMASSMYSHDNRDYMAYPNWGNSYSWRGWLYTPSTGTVPQPGSDPTAVYRTGLWFPYVQNPKTYLCPVDSESPTFSSRANKLSSYVMNGAVSGYNAYASPGSKTSDAWNPGCYLLFGPDENYGGPGMPGAFVFNDAANYPDRNECVERLHLNSGGLILTVAGNTVFVTQLTFLQESLKTTRSLTWWSPFTTNGR